MEDCQDEDCLSECRDFHKLEEDPLEYCEARSCKVEEPLREWECLVECTPDWRDLTPVWQTALDSRDCWEDSGLCRHHPLSVSLLSAGQDQCRKTVQS